MPPTTSDTPSPSDSPLASAEPAETCDLHVKRVPKATWLKARQNALLSSLSFRDYVIRVLDECQPSPGQPKGSPTLMTDDPCQVSR